MVFEKGRFKMQFDPLVYQYPRRNVASARKDGSYGATFSPGRAGMLVRAVCMDVA